MFVEHKEQGEAVPLKVGTPKLSEAIRAGCFMRAQSHISMFDDGKTCAQGAALMGLGNRYGDLSGFPERLISMLGGNPEVIVPDGSDAGKLLPLIGHTGAIASLNDEVGRVKWSRERIAGWLESQGY